MQKSKCETIQVHARALIHKQRVAGSNEQNKKIATTKSR